MKSSMKKLVVWRKCKKSKKKHLSELQKNYVKAHREWAGCQRVVTDNAKEGNLERNREDQGERKDATRCNNDARTGEESIKETCC